MVCLMLSELIFLWIRTQYGALGPGTRIPTDDIMPRHDQVVRHPKLVWPMPNLSCCCGQQWLKDKLLMWHWQSWSDNGHTGHTAFSTHRCIIIRMDLERTATCYHIRGSIFVIQALSPPPPPPPVSPVRGPGTAPVSSDTPHPCCPDSTASRVPESVYTEPPPAPSDHSAAYTPIRGPR